MMHSTPTQQARNLLVFLCTLCCMSSVFARPFLVQGESVTLRPKLWLSSSYDTNVFYEAPTEPTGAQPNDGILLKFGGGFILENRHKDHVDLFIDSTLAYRNYVYMDDENGQLSDQVRESRNGLDFAKAKAYLVIGTRSDFQLKLKEDFSYIERPIYENTLFGYERVENRSGLELQFAPGSSSISGPLALSLGYTLHNIGFLNDSSSVAIQGRSEKQGHILSLMTRWRFLPKNYLTLDVNYALNDYNDFAAIDEENVTQEALSRDSAPLRVQLGLTGLLSTRISVFLKGGYANTFNQAGLSYSGFIGLFQVSYVYVPRIKLSAGYQRDGRDSGFSNFYTLNRYFLKINWSLTTKTNVIGDVSFDEYTYDAANAVGDSGRVDPVLRAQLKISTPLYRTFRVQLGWTFESNYTEYTLPTGSMNPTDFAQYQRQLFTFSFNFN